MGPLARAPAKRIDAAPESLLPKWRDRKASRCVPRSLSLEARHGYVENQMFLFHFSSHLAREPRDRLEISQECAVLSMLLSHLAGSSRWTISSAACGAQTRRAPPPRPLDLIQQPRRTLSDGDTGKMIWRCTAGTGWNWPSPPNIARYVGS